MVAEGVVAEGTPSGDKGNLAAAVFRTEDAMDPKESASQTTAETSGRASNRSPRACVRGALSLSQEGPMSWRSSLDV